jgi:hypothetical protein
MRLIFLKLEVDLCGNTNELGDIGTYFWKSFLFFLTPRKAMELDHPEIWLYWR